MEKSDFDELLERYLTGKVSDQEKIKIEAWLDVMKTEDITGLELSKKDEDRLFDKIARKTGNVDEVIAFRPGQQKETSAGTWAMRIAASLLILSLATYAGWYFTNSPGDRQEAESKSGVEKIILNDGSLAWLRGKSKLVYYEKAEGIRYAELNGEALFEVAKDAKHPFIISCGEITAKVLGTSFSIKTDSSGVELEVLTGKVSLSSSSDKTGIVVEPNEKVVYHIDGKIEMTGMEVADVANITEHTEYDMQFKNTGMDQVLERIEKKFSVSINVENKQLTRCRITADFTDRSLQGTLKMISELLELDYVITGSKVAISGKGCN